MADDELDVVTYVAEFNVPAIFGPVGAVLVTNEHGTEMFLKDVKVVTAGAGGGNSWAPLLIQCHSWLQPKSGDAAVKRVFFDKVIKKLRSSRFSHFMVKQVLRALSSLELTFFSVAIFFWSFSINTIPAALPAEPDSSRSRELPEGGPGEEVR